MNKTFLSLIASTIILTGCATTKSIQYPAKGSNTTLSVSSEQISAMTESGGGDHFIEGSQITVGDASNALANPASGMFGLIGVGVATAIDKKMNGSAISKSNLKQAIKFDAMVNQKITSALEKNLTDTSLKMLALNQPSDIKVVPFARLSFREKPDVTAIFGLKAEFKNAADNHSSTKRLYNYISQKKAPLTEWDANNNAMFFTQTNGAFDALSQVLALDIQHQLNLEATSEIKQKECKSTTAWGSLTFIEAPENLCIGVLKNNKGKVFQNMVLVIEQ